MAAEIVEKTAGMGLPPLETEYRKIKDCNSGATIGLRSVLKINSLELGVLYPEQYTLVANRNIHGVRLANWTFKKVLEEADRLFVPGFDGFVSVYFPTKMLLKGDVTNAYLSIMTEENEEIVKRIRPEFSADLLLADSDKVRTALSEFRDKLGIGMILSGFGDEFCPVLRLSGLPFESVILCQQISDARNISSAKTGAAIKLISDLDMDCIMESADPVAVSDGFRNGCNYYCDTVGQSAKRVMR